MKKLGVFTLLLALTTLAAPLYAQDTGTTTQTTTTRTQVDTDDDDDWHYNHGSVGIFFDYLRLDAADTNNMGIGGRFGFNVHPNVQLEGEIAYDFRESRTVSVTDVFTTTTYLANFRVLHGLFGPKFQTKGNVRVFGVVKGGFINFGVTTRGAPAGFVNSFGDVVDGDTHPVLYPGGGIELGAGWFAIRGEVGDEIYFQDGARHNLKFTAGPVFRF
jgi:hypothetical protein